MPFGGTSAKAPTRTTRPSLAAVIGSVKTLIGRYSLTTGAVGASFCGSLLVVLVRASTLCANLVLDILLNQHRLQRGLIEDHHAEFLRLGQLAASIFTGDEIIGVA